MHSLEDHKKQVEKMIVEAIVTALESKKVAEQELPTIADYILGRIDNIQNHTQLVAFVTDLASKWPFFKNIEEIEKGEEKRALENQAATHVLKLIKNGQPKDALNYAKSII